MVLAPPELPWPVRRSETTMHEITLSILNTLLNRWEQHWKRRTARPFRVVVNMDNVPGYQLETRDIVHQECQALAHRGLIRLKWHVMQYENWLKSVVLLDPKGVYACLQRSSPAEQQAHLAQALAEFEPTAPWMQDWKSKMEQELENRRFPAPFRPNQPEWNLDLLRAVAAVGRQTGDTCERSFSAAVLGDSKRLRELRGALASILYHHAPHPFPLPEDETAILRAFGLFRPPEYVRLAGPALVNGAWTGGLPSLAVPPTVLAGEVHTPAVAVLTVENLSSFELLAQHRPPGLLILYTAGFGALPVIGSLLNRLGCPARHWGDIDPSGWRILAGLRDLAPQVAPLAMDAAWLERFRAVTVPLTRGQKQELALYRSRTGLPAQLEEAMWRLGVLEQEHIPLHVILAELQQWLTTLSSPTVHRSEVGEVLF